MARPVYYSPAIRRFLVSVLYHEAKARRVPMTRLTNELLTAALKDSEGWRKAREVMQVAESPTSYDPNE